MRRFLHALLRFFIFSFLSAGAAFFASLAFPSFISDSGFGALAFVSMIPLFFIVNKASWKGVWFYGFVYGFVFYLVYNYWLKTFHPLAILLAPTLKSVQYLLLFPILKGAGKVLKKRGYLLQTLCYVSFLYLTQQGFLGYPYGENCAALYQMPVFLQLASITGIWGIDFLLILPQAFIAEGRYALRHYLLDYLLYGICFAFWIVFGFVSYHYYDVKAPEKTVRIAAVQHSADSWKGGYDTYKRNFEVLRDLSLEAMKEKPDFVLWSETAFVPSVAWHTAHPTNIYTSALCNDFVRFGSNLGVPLITGNPEGLVKDENLPAVMTDGAWNWKTYNTVILFDRGGIEGQYRKQHLVPFTEYFPYEKEFPSLYRLLLANDYKWWEKGEDCTVFSSNGISFSTPICFEDIFGCLNAKFVAAGADMLLNLTNDSWSGSVPAEMQHMQLASLRAIENRRPLLRGTNSGITCLVEPSGKIVGMMEPFVQDYHIYNVPLGKKKGLTFYTRHPDLFAYIIIVSSLALYLISLALLPGRVKKERMERLCAYYTELLDQLDDRYWV